ncbi:hypothetical protein [Neisseria lactamica]|uniref:hypothetical protein n=1 Tax=Neisseria lactamica TaxID=486 RepID=UPI001EFDDA35|nr:hypothetical protein [Neisseria lactamica]
MQTEIRHVVDDAVRRNRAVAADLGNQGLHVRQPDGGKSARFGFDHAHQRDGLDARDDARHDCADFARAAMCVFGAVLRPVILLRL